MATLSPETLDRLNKFKSSDKFKSLSPETQARLDGFLSSNSLEPNKQNVSDNPLSTDFLTQARKGLYEKVPFMKTLAKLDPEYQAKAEAVPEAKGLSGKVGRGLGEAAPTIVMAAPFVSGGSALAQGAKFIPQAAKGVAGSAIGFGAFEGTKAAVKGEKDKMIPAAIGGAASGALLGAGGQIGSNLMSKFAPALKYGANVGTAAGQAAVAGAMAPEGDKETQAIIAGGLGLISPISPIKGKSSEQKINDVINEGISKGIRPSVSGKKNSADVKSYYNNANEAVKLIVGNKENLKLQDADGNVVSKVPESLYDFAQAIEQTKGNIFKKYDALTEQSGKQGAVVDLSGIVKILDTAAKNKIINIKSPETVSYINSLKDRLSSSGSLKPSEAQELIKSYNDSLQAYYRNPSYDTASRATVDAAIVNNLRTELDSTINKTLNTPEYSSLKKQYGALKAIEKDVVNRSVVDARKNTKGLIDFTDILSGGDIVNGVLTLNPSSIAKGAAQIGIKNYFKMINEPNTVVKNMFSKVDKLYSKNINSNQSVNKQEVNVVNNPVSSEFNPLNKSNVKKSMGAGLGAGAVGLGMSLSSGDAEASTKIKNDDIQRYALDPLSYTKTEEGFRGKIYKDTKGKKTIGYGFNIEEPFVKAMLPKDVINGRRQLTKEEAEPIFRKLYSKAQMDAKIIAGNGWSKMNDKQKQVLSDMVYNMGLHKVNGFKDMKAAIRSGNWNNASKEILDSDYARKDAPNRARRNSYLMKLVNNK